MKSRSFRKTRQRVLLVPVSASLVVGCYAYAPTSQSVFPEGTSVAFELNDLGRVNLANRIGPEVLQLAGVLHDETSSDYTIRVEELTYLNGQTSQWSGEAVTVKQEYVKSAMTKKFSSGRTTAAVIAGVGIVGGALLANSLNSSGAGGGDTKPPPGGSTIRILHWNFRIP